MDIKALETRIKSDVYFRAEMKRVIQSCLVVDGIIAKEVEKLHTCELKYAFSEIIFSMICKRAGLYDCSEEKYLEICSKMYRREKELEMIP